MDSSNTVISQMCCSCWLLLPTGSQPAAGEERRRQSQRPSHGNRQDPLCSQQLPAVPSSEGHSGGQHKIKLSSHCVPVGLIFVLRVSRLKSFSRTCWREKSLEVREIPLCFRLRSLPLPKSECASMMLVQFFNVSVTWSWKHPRTQVPR